MINLICTADRLPFTHNGKNKVFVETLLDIIQLYDIYYVLHVDVIVNYTRDAVAFPEMFKGRECKFVKNGNSF